MKSVLDYMSPSEVWKEIVTLIDCRWQINSTIRHAASETFKFRCHKMTVLSLSPLHLGMMRRFPSVLFGFNPDVDTVHLLLRLE